MSDNFLHLVLFWPSVGGVVNKRFSGNRKLPPTVARHRGQGVITGLAARKNAVLFKGISPLNRPLLHVQYLVIMFGFAPHRPAQSWSLHPVTPARSSPPREEPERKPPKGVALQFDINSVGKQTEMTLSERFRLLKDQRVAAAQQSSKGGRFVTVA
uniref:UAP56-interacting factor n=1 Tax=Sinocyclocheilus anshuiensis TaxID=1608454 RepID=A0A671QAR9_9TELE